MAANNLEELFRLKDIVSDLRTKVEGGGTRQQRQAWLAEQQEALKSIRAIVAQNKARRAGGVAPLQTQRNESATRLNQSVQKRLSNQRQYSSLARLARNDLRTVYSMSQEHVLSFQPPRQHQVQEQVRTEQDTAQRARAQQVAVQRNHELFEAARMLVDPDELDDLMTRAFDAEVDVEAAEYGASQMRDMLLAEPARDQEGAVATPASGPPGLPSPAEVRQSVADWYDAETRSNAHMRSVVRSTLDLAGYESLMTPELPARSRQTEDQVRAQQDVDQPPPMTAPQRIPTPEHDYEAMMRPEADPRAMAYAQRMQEEATSAAERLQAAQEADWQDIGRMDQEILRATESRNNADPTQHEQYTNRLRTLAVNRMRTGRRLAMRAQIQQLYEAERAREAVILHPDVIGDGQMLWDAEGDLEMMFSGLPTRRPAPLPGIEDRGQQDAGQPGLPGSPGYTPPGQYTIEEGDTLSEIAQRVGSTVEALAAANNIRNPDRIYAGATLQIPEADTSAATMPPEQYLSITPEELEARSAGALALRMNNPMALRWNPDNPWEGRTTPQERKALHRPGTIGNFEAFSHPAWGIRAGVETLDTYNQESEHDIQSIYDAIERWAPAADANHPREYADSIIVRLREDGQYRESDGVPVFDSRDYEQMFSMVRAIIEIEGGGAWLTDEFIRSAMLLARTDTGEPLFEQGTE